MKLLLVNQYFEPDIAASGQIAADICRSLAKDFGIEVHVVTGEPSYTEQLIAAPAYEERDGVFIHRIPMGKARGRMSLSTRLKGYLRFLRRAKRLSRDIVKEHGIDTVMTMTNPPFVAAIGSDLKKRGLRFVFAVHDIHPDVLIATGWSRLPKPILHLWNEWSKRVLRNADDIVVLGDEMKNTIVEEKGVDASKVHAIPLWGRPELSGASFDEEMRSELGCSSQDKLILFAGNMGIMHPLDPILDAAKQLQDERVKFLFLGGGAKKSEMIKRVESEQISNVTFLPFQPEEQFIRILAAADACVVTLEPGLEKVAVPSRSFTFMSAGKPIIAIMSEKSVVAKTVHKSGCGWVTRDPIEIADAIRRTTRDGMKSMGALARIVYDSKFRKDRVLQRYADLLLGNRYAAVSSCCSESEAAADVA
jgi:glycosyltransferase involved in cell wall biosynthesis